MFEAFLNVPTDGLVRMPPALDHSFTPDVEDLQMERYLLNGVVVSNVAYGRFFLVPLKIKVLMISCLLRCPVHRCLAVLRPCLSIEGQSSIVDVHPRGRLDHFIHHNDRLPEYLQ
jgi:hypothetical protein